MKGYKDYMNTRTINPVLHEKIMKKVIQPPKPVYQNRPVVWFAMAAACILLFGLWAVPHFFSSPNTINDPNGFVANQPNTPQYGGQSGYIAVDLSQSEIENDSLSPEFIGLPVDNHCLPQENPMASRFGVSSLLDIFGDPNRADDFWAERPVQAFAFARVIEISQEEYSQISTLEVLKTVWSRGPELPETMTLTQFSGAIMCCSPYGELMRVGGVFLLPLWYNDGIDTWRELGWYNWTYFDVLFEVDNNGSIWSRSNLSAFNRFDGRHTSVLTNAILSIANAEENLGRDIAHSIFGRAADEGVLAIISKVSSESRLLFPTGQALWENSYVVRVDEIRSMPTSFGLQRGGWLKQQQRWQENWQTSGHWWQNWEQDSEITVVNTSFSSSVLVAGERYLVFITPSYGNWSSQFTFYSESAASINADGTISTIPSMGNNWDVFEVHNGYTIRRLTELAKLANTWHERYAE